MSERSAELTDCVRAYSGPHHKGERKYMDFWERLFARAGRRKPEPSAEAKCAEEWDTELASELSETEREQLKKAGCIRKHIYFSGRVQAVGFQLQRAVSGKRAAADRLGEKFNGWTCGSRAAGTGRIGRLVCGAYQSAWQDCRRVCGRGGPRTLL